MWYDRSLVILLCGILLEHRIRLGLPPLAPVIRPQEKQLWIDPTDKNRRQKHKQIMDLWNGFISRQETHPGPPPSRTPPHSREEATFSHPLKHNSPDVKRIDVTYMDDNRIIWLRTVWVVIRLHESSLAQNKFPRRPLLKTKLLQVAPAAENSLATCLWFKNGSRMCWCSLGLGNLLKRTT